VLPHHVILLGMDGRRAKVQAVILAGMLRLVTSSPYDQTAQLIPALTPKSVLLLLLWWWWWWYMSGILPHPG